MSAVVAHVPDAARHHTDSAGEALPERRTPGDRKQSGNATEIVQHSCKQRMGPNISRQGGASDDRFNLPSPSVRTNRAGQAFTRHRAATHIGGPARIRDLAVAASSRSPRAHGGAPARRGGGSAVRCRTRGPRPIHRYPAFQRGAGGIHAPPPRERHPAPGRAGVHHRSPSRRLRHLRGRGTHREVERQARHGPAGHDPQPSLGTGRAMEHDAAPPAGGSHPHAIAPRRRRRLVLVHVRGAHPPGAERDLLLRAGLPLGLLRHGKRSRTRAHRIQ